MRPKMTSVTPPPMRLLNTDQRRGARSNKRLAPTNTTPLMLAHHLLGQGCRRRLQRLYDIRDLAVLGRLELDSEVALGFHALEYFVYHRPLDDFTNGAINLDRRRQLVILVAEILLADITAFSGNLSSRLPVNTSSLLYSLRTRNQKTCRRNGNSNWSIRNPTEKPVAQSPVNDVIYTAQECAM